MNSENIENKNERIEKLSPEIKVHSEILDAEFNLFNVNGFNNNFFTVPGSSSRDYKFVIKIKNAHIPLWTKDLEKVKGNLETEKWMKSLGETRQNNWKTISEPIFYKRKNEPNGTIIVFEKEGIIYKHINQL
ncbi:hypothetical protein [Flavobacterium tyrosinilyticum]|uniref:hypothetical protein n=1 Tax=Flavobacterium tyrosinilyticum TaxID=1658740 RepID=UPI00202E5D7A|nr:hypothetical protein [Flavobacterium tyrosinilyticum]MCM0666077.1 hypothetical protein [Flavobacterium tyrosinilyticum]